MRGIDELKRQVENAGPDLDRAVRIENLKEDLMSSQRWLELQLTRTPVSVNDDMLWISCAHSFSQMAQRALKDLTECHRELVAMKEAAGDPVASE